jgi:hypothetical protein
MATRKKSNPNPPAEAPPAASKLDPGPSEALPEPTPAAPATEPSSPTMAGPTASKTVGSRTAAKDGARKPAQVKLSDRQREFLQRIHGAGEAGFEVGQKNDQRTIDALMDRKLIKRGAKNKESGRHRYLLSKTGLKHLPPPGTPS